MERVVGKNLEGITVDIWDNAISRLEPLLTAAVDSPCASLGLGQF